MTNMLRALMEKIDNMQDQIDNFSRQIETVQKNQVKIKTKPQ